MAQPYNYMVQAPSAFESLVSGLKIGTSLQEMEAQRQQRMLQAQAMQQKMQDDRRRQEMLQGLRQKPFAQWGSDDLLTAVETLPKEGLTFLQQQMSAMSAEERRARAMEMGTLASIALSGNKDMLASQFDERIELAPTPQAKQSLMAQKQAALLNPEAFAKYATGILPALGDEGKNVAENLLKVHGGLSAKAPEAFQTLDAAAVEKQFGIKNVPPGLYRLNTQTQKLESIGGGGTTVNIKNEGPIAQDYRRVRDAQGNILYDEPIPGTKAAREAEQAIKAAESRASGQVRTASTVTQSIDSLLSDLKKEKEAKGTEKISPYTRITGVTGKTFEGYPGGARQTAKGYIDTIRANIGFDRLDQMRQESPTGGALGQIAVQEIQFLQASLGSLDLDADPDVLIKNLERIKTAYDNVMRKAAAYPNAAKYGFGTGAEPAAGGTAATPPGAGQRPPLESIFSR